MQPADDSPGWSVTINGREMQPPIRRACARGYNHG